MVEVFKESPLTLLFLAAIIGYTIVHSIRSIVRGFTIRKNGWPPQHCDGDGSLREETINEEEQ